MKPEFTAIALIRCNNPVNCNSTIHIPPKFKNSKTNISQKLQFDFWNMRSVLLVSLMPEGKTVTTNVYSGTLISTGCLKQKEGEWWHMAYSITMLDPVRTAHITFVLLNSANEITSHEIIHCIVKFLSPAKFIFSFTEKASG